MGCARRKCIDCSHCKTRVFENAKDLDKWCCLRDSRPRKAWLEYLAEFKKIRLIWCDLQMSVIGVFWPRNANPVCTSNLDTIDIDIDKVNITNRNRKLFIPDCTLFK